MKNFFLSFIVIPFLSLILVYSCSNENVRPEIKIKTQYTLTVIVGEGGVVIPEASGTYDEGAQLTLSAIPDKGYVFCRWLGTDNDSTNCLERNLSDLDGAQGKSRCIIKMNSNREVEAFFKIKLE